MWIFANKTRRLLLITCFMTLLCGLTVLAMIPLTLSASTCTAPTWDSSTIYTNGDVVAHNGREWRAKWWTQGEEPGTTGQWGVWADLGVCPGIPSPTHTTIPTTTPTQPSLPSPSPTQTPDSPTLTPTHTPTPIPTVTTPPGNSCQGLPHYAAGTAYTTGQFVQNISHKYQCDVAGWCSSTAAWAYEPGVGLYWETAWTYVSACEGNDPTPTPITSPTATTNPSITPTPTNTPGSGDPPAKPSVSIQKVWDVGGGDYYDIIWSKWVGPDATSWQLLEEGIIIHTGTLNSSGAQTATYRVTDKTYGHYVYQVVLINEHGTTVSDEAGYAVGGASPIELTAVDAGQGRQALQVTIDQGTTDFDLTVFGTVNPNFSLATNNSTVITFQIIDGTTLRLTGLQTGRASLRITDTTSGEVRFLGVRVRTANGAAPGMPDYVSIGSVSEDRVEDLDFWRDFDDDLTNKRMDIRYIYINGGPFTGWRTWTNKDGDRAISYVRESLKLGMIPYFVYYNIPDTAESYEIDKQHIEDPAYMEAYYQDLQFFLDIAKVESGDEMVGVVLEPDFLGYMMQQSGGAGPPVPPNQLLARVDAAYNSGVLTAGVDPTFSNTITGLVESVNYLIDKNLPNAYFGWQFNHWAAPGIPGSGLMRLTDDLGISNGRVELTNFATDIVNYYLAAGVTSYGADFVSIDKYGLDAGSSTHNNPAESVWFWNADHWHNYLLFCQVMHNLSDRPVILWQIPVGHTNHSLTPDPYNGGTFPDLNNTAQHFEDSSPTFFLGDVFQPGANRLAYFATNEGGDPKVSVSGNTITWGAHMEEVRDHGIISVLFGAGVGGSTDGVGSPPTDTYWWITKVQAYYLNPVPLPSGAAPN